MTTQFNPQCPLSLTLNEFTVSSPTDSIKHTKRLFNTTFSSSCNNGVHAVKKLSRMHNLHLPPHGCSSDDTSTKQLHSNRIYQTVSCSNDLTMTC